MRKPEIYISAANVDLGVVASMIQSEILAIGANPIYLDSPPRAWEAATSLLEHHLSRSDAVIHVAGECHGMEPDDHPPGETRRSFAQLEYTIARSLGKLVFVFICSADFPYSEHAKEDPERTTLQRLHRERLVRHNTAPREARTSEELREWVRALQTQVAGLTPSPLEAGPGNTSRRTTPGDRVVQRPWHPPSQATEFVGRTLQRESTVEALKQHKRVALVGAPGIGKTALAARCLDDVAPGPERPGLFSGGIFRHSFYSSVSHHAAMASIVAQSGLENIPDTRHEAAVRQILSSPNVCLCLEGCEKAASLDTLLALAGEAHLLVEGRESLNLHGFHVVEVHQLPVEDAVFLLYRSKVLAGAKDRSMPPLDDPVWQKLARRLGAHPLILRMSARRMFVDNIAPESFLKSLEEENVNLFETVETEPARVLRSFSHCIAEFAISAPQALSCWQALSLHAFAPVPQSILAAVLGVAEADLDSHLELLKERGFLEETSVPGLTTGTVEKAWKLSHMILAEAAQRQWEGRDPMPQQQSFDPQAGYLRWRDWWLNLLHRCWKSRTVEGGAVRYVTMVPHLDALVAGIERHEGASSPHLLAALRWLAALHRLMGRFATAQPLSERLVSLTESLHGPEHPDTLAALNNLATLHYRKGDVAASEPLYRRILNLREKILGPDHPDTLSSQNNMANVLADHGHVAEAEHLYRASLEGRRRVLGTEEQDTLVSAKNLANLLLDKGDFEGAEPLYKETLSVQARVLGFSHPDTAMTAYNYARLCTQQRRLQEAFALARHAAQAARLSFPEGHPHRQRYEQLLSRLTPYEPSPEA